MPYSNRNSIVVTWLAVAISAICITAWITWNWTTYLTEERVRAEKTAEYHDGYAEERIREECLSLELMAIGDCIHEQIEAARDHQRSEQDLDAQQTMAKFTRLMGWTAAVGLVVGMCSVVLIFLTLRATQQMATETRDIGEAQVRAYLAVDRVSIKEYPDAITYTVSIKNVGNSPTKGAHGIVQGFLLNAVIENEQNNDRRRYSWPQKKIIPDLAPNGAVNEVFAIPKRESFFDRYCENEPGFYPDFGVEIDLSWDDVFNVSHRAWFQAKTAVEVNDPLLIEQRVQVKQVTTADYKDEQKYSRITQNPPPSKRR